jgi:putative photosynthetic complex assembly protein 2
MDYVLPIGYALVLWWFSTGLIFFLDSLPVRTFKWSMLAASLVFAAALVTLTVTVDDTSVTGAYAAFTAGLLAWGWQEISLYMGYVTGPRKHRCQAGCSGWQHFGHAISVNLWHELSIIATAVVIAWLTWDGTNVFGLWTYLLLWLMHLSARLNVFLGVRNISEEFVPVHMDVLKSFLRKKSMNFLFPISVMAAAAGSVLLFRHAAWVETDFESTGFTLLAAMMALALVEHVLLMLPLPVERLFHWALSSRHARQQAAGGTRTDQIKFTILET